MDAGIQGPAGAFVSSITGCYFNVMGFPVHRFGKEISDLIKDGTINL
jgi:septum formation protein